MVEARLAITRNRSRTALCRTGTRQQPEDPARSLGSADDGELFLEYRQSESLVYDDGKLKSAAYDTTQGFGLRAVAGETTAYAHSSEISEPALKRAAETVRSAAQERAARWHCRRR